MLHTELFLVFWFCLLLVNQKNLRWVVSSSAVFCGIIRRNFIGAENTFMIEQIIPITVSAQNLCRNFGNYAAVRGVDLELKQGQVLGLLGPNGAGKTSTLRMLTGNLAPSVGSIKICGVDLLDKPRDAKAHIGYLPETPPLYQDMTVDEYLRFVAKLHRVQRQEIQIALDGVKQRCGLNEVGKRLISTLSKGYQQRVGIAQAIIHDPDVIILDEPTVGLDPNQMREIRALICELGAQHSVILSTHILSEVEVVCDQVKIMHQGRIIFSDTRAGLKQKETSLEEMFSQLTSSKESMRTGGV